MEFLNLVRVLRLFRLNYAPSRESEIEMALEIFLKSHNIPVNRQVTIHKGRLDLVIDRYIIEVKLVGKKNIADQLDRYSGHCEGLIVVCWKATDPLRAIFVVERSSSKIPVELIEIRNACGIV
jgi:hypothetical protein